MLHTDELSTISFTKHMPKLKKLYVFNTNYEIKELYNTHTSQLSTLYGIQHCHNMEKITIGYCHCNSIRYIKYLSKLRKIECNICRFRELPTLHTYNLSNVCFSNCNLRSIKGLRYCYNIKYLDISFNSLKSIKWLFRCIKIRTLLCNNNYITSLHGLENCLDLKELK